jgi:phosphoglycolate phosphatase-like HAD superfamily hydrolase
VGKTVKTGTVIFDWDGTLADIDEREYLCINEALASIGSPKLSRKDYVDGYYSKPYENPGARLLLRKILNDKKKAEEAINAYSKRFSETISLTRLQDGAYALLQNLKRKQTPVAVATLRRSRKVFEEEMRHLSIKDCVDVLVTLEDMPPGSQTQRIFSVVAKVRADQFSKALSLLKKPPSEAIIVGDAWWDIRATKEIHALSVWVKTGFGTYHDFRTEQPDIIIENLKELAEKIKKYKALDSCYKLKNAENSQLQFDSLG